MQNIERYRIAYDLREQGLSLRKIGEELGVSANRVNVYIRKYEEIISRPESQQWMNMFPASLVNSLKGHGIYDESDLIDALRAGSLKDAAGVGAGSMSMLVEKMSLKIEDGRSVQKMIFESISFLEKHGYIVTKK